MADPITGPITKCPWCSAELSLPGAERCLACGAALTSQGGGVDPEIKGVTTLDPEAILRARSEVARPRNLLLPFIYGVGPTPSSGPASPESLAPPSDEVRREMLRLEYEAERANLMAETIALKSDVLARHGIHVSQLAGDVSVHSDTGLVAATDRDAGEGPDAVVVDGPAADAVDGPEAATDPQAEPEAAIEAATGPQTGPGGSPQA